jgi:glycosyltransferase involved in cell wall biosynthesis
MRIAMLSTPFVPVPPCKYGGTELVVHELVEELAARGHEVVLFATGDSRTSAELRFLYQEAQWPPNPFSDLNHVSWAMRQVQDEDFDVVHAHSACALALWRAAAPSRRPPLVYTLHHVREQPLSAFYQCFPKVHFVAISRDQARREVALPHLAVVRHGLDPAHYLCTDRPGDYVCFLGRLAQVKGPHIAIDVAQAAGVPIRVAGEAHVTDLDFAEREVFPRLALPHVTHLGSIGLAEKVPLLRNARAMLAPLEWHEPFGLAMLEAMLSGCPVVAFSRGSAPELIEERVTGFLAQDAREMSELIRPGGVLDHFDRRRCRALAAERFGKARMADEYERVYVRAIEESHALRLLTPELGVTSDVRTTPKIA